MTIKEILAQHPDLVWSFFEHTGTTIVVLTDEQYVITDCNANLTRALYVPSKPVGRYLGELLCPLEDTDFSLIVSMQGQTFLPQILRICYTEVLYRCYTFAFQNTYFVLGDRLGSTDNEVLESMSALNNELSTLGRELSKKNRELEEANARISELMRTDPLTKLANRRFFQERFGQMFSLAQRQHLPLSVVMLDIDHFKAVNDTFGHAAGDKVLAALGDLLQKGTREEDLAARFGGEEFIVCLPHTRAGQAWDFAQRIRSELAGLDILSNGYTITISAGAAELVGGDSVDELINRADKALYRAKEAGRDRVVIAGEDS
ncbi:GGDEF domain-containing protein [Desulfovermiculus halophilus]|jgi:diguanylate cyclase (GGDEF)-like protein|uniref:GGDEF domain-containing protein n=1 Tax=Desulfovermiculus halophilus TaxID=339722 RepID=UPI0006886F50|nr:GGDEF domain-containing protein [Desulfovermiculus halophilus]